MARIEVMAVASFGGHLEQLLQLRSAWDGCACVYVTTRDDRIDLLSGQRVVAVQDCHEGQTGRAFRCLAQLVGLALRYRPRTVLTTGALPGLMACIAGRTIGAQVIWIDSVANAAELSKSGRIARRLAHHHFSQWPDVARASGSEYAGSVL